MGDGADFYRSPEWKAIRARMPPKPCKDCGRPWTKSFNLDHDKPRRLGGSDNPDNLIWRCWPCHSRKTAQRDGGFGNRPRFGCDTAGRPLDPAHPWNRAPR